jgi:hypothetical protein
MERVPLSYTVTSAPLLRIIAMEAFFAMRFGLVPLWKAMV